MNIKDLIKIKKSLVEKPAAEAYDLWSSTYDGQPGNLMLDLDEEIFTSLFNKINISDRSVADIGCGTGRHWKKILEKHPANLTGFDVSEGMLQKLKDKFPGSNTLCIHNNLFGEIPDSSYDVIISTLTVAHIKNIDEAINAWCRILKKDGEIIITDFHPASLAKGGKRTFINNKKTLAVTNYIHPIHTIKSLFLENGFICGQQLERYVDDNVKEYYTAQNALPVFEKFKGTPVIYGLYLKGTDGTK